MFEKIVEHVAPTGSSANPIGSDIMMSDPIRPDLISMLPDPIGQKSMIQYTIRSDQIESDIDDIRSDWIGSDITDLESN